MKQLFILFSLLFVCFAGSSQITKTYTLNSDAFYYEFKITTDDILAEATGKTSATFTLLVNKGEPVEVVWYVDLDTIAYASGTDSLNFDIKYNYKIFSDESYTTLKTITYDGDGTGDYGALVADSSYLYPTGQSNWNNVPMTRPEFGRYYQLSITQTTGAGMGVINDRLRIVAIKAKVYKR
jgi:hypothetical protein